MNRIQNAFAGKKAFIPFITCGDPDLATTVEIVKSMAANGADLIELGIPFPTPLPKDPLFREPTCAPSPVVLPRTKFLTWCAPSARMSPYRWCS